MNNLQKHEAFLKLFATSNPKLRKVLIQSASKEQIKLLIEIILNLLNGNVPLTQHELKKLSKYKSRLREIAKHAYRKKLPIRKTRNLINQTGTGLPAVISILLPLLGKAILSGAVGASSAIVVKKLLKNA